MNLRPSVRQPGVVGRAGRALLFSLFAAGAAAQTPPAEPPPPPPVPPVVPVGAPPSAPFGTNPFLVANETDLPAPLPPPKSAPPKLTCDVHRVQFDGVNAPEETFTGPDFQWDVDPLYDWSFTSPEAGEEVALICNETPLVRLSFTLYHPGDLLPTIDAPSIVRYLAGIRSQSPKTFVLVTPIGPNDTQVNSVSFHGAPGQWVAYYNIPPSGKLKDVVEHIDYFVDLYGYYQMLIQLSGPPGWLAQLQPPLQFNLRRSAIKSGLGLPPAPTTTSAPATPGANPSGPPPGQSG